MKVFHGTASTRSQIVVVQAGDRRFGFLAADVIEAQRMVAWEGLPGAPPAVEGVIDLRGRLVPVLDLLERLGLPSRAPTPEDFLVILDSGTHLVAVRVHDVLELRELPSDDLEHTDRIVPAGPRVAGLARLGDGLVVVVDVAAFLDWQESEALARALAESYRPGAPQ